MADQQLKIDLTARDKTAAAFRSLNTRLAATRKAAVSLSGAIRKTTLAAGALGAGVLVATKKALNFADDIAKIADKVGVTTDALQEYRFAAELAGVKSDELDKALRKLQQSAGEARTKGTGTAADTFRLLGLEADLASGKLEDGVVRFRAVVDALSKVESQADKASLAAGLFGARLGPQMMNLLNQGIPAIDKAGARLRSFNGIINESVLRTSEKAVDAITELETIIKKQLTNALVQAGPQIIAFADAFMKNMPTIIQNIQELAYWLGIIERTKIQTLQLEIEELQETIAKTSQPARGMVDLLNTKIAELAAAKAAAREMKGMVEISPRPQPSGHPYMSTKAKTESLIQIRLRERILQAQNRSRIVAESELRLMELNSFEREKQLKYEEIMHELSKENVQLTQGQHKLLMEDLEREFEVKRTMDARNKAAERQKELQQQIADIMKDGIQTANEAISGLISGTMKWKDALGLVLKKVLDIVTTMGKGGKSGGGFNIGSLFKMGLSMFAASQGVPATPMGTSTGPMFPGLMDFHTGGVVGQGPRGFRSDERMILARTGERVLNRGQTAISSGGNGVVLNQTVNLTTGIQQTVRAEVMSMAPQIAAQAKAAVLDAKRRGGSYAAAFA